MTISLAAHRANLQRLGAPVEGGAEPNGADPARIRAHLLRAADVTERRVRWLWPDRIPLGKLTGIDGDPGLMKSTILLDLGARVSTGTAFPDGAPCERGGVVVLSAEDGPADTIVPRLRVARADLSRVTILDSVLVDGEKRAITFPSGASVLRDVVRAEKARLVIVDPLAAYHDEDVNPWKDSDVRRMLRPLAELAEEEAVAVLLARHWNKSGSANPKYRGGGSIAYTAAVRAGFCVAEEPGDTEGHMVLAHVKHNLSARAPSLRYRGEAVDGTVRVSWCGTSTYEAPDLTEDPEKRALGEEVTEALRELLGDGHPHQEQDIWREVRKRTGASLPTYKRARRKLGVRAAPAGWQGPSMLTLPTDYKQDEREGLRVG